MVDEIINVLKEKQCYGCEHWYYECQIPFDGCERFLELSPDEIAELAEHLEKNDVIKVVRCKDCKHYMNLGNKYSYCLHFSVEDDVLFMARADSFCSDGERRLENENT